MTRCAFPEYVAGGHANEHFLKRCLDARNNVSSVRGGLYISLRIYTLTTIQSSAHYSRTQSYRRKKLTSESDDFVGMQKYQGNWQFNVTK